jgi:hypothetical protein
MSRFRFLGVALLAALALAATMASSASALVLPQIEPQQATWTGASEGATKLTSLGGTITCQKATAEGTEELPTTDKSLGLFHIDFKECKEEKNKVACNSKGDTSGIILSLGTWHLVYDKFSKVEGGTEAELGVAILFLIGQGGEADTVFECGFGLVKIEVLGQVLCLVLAYKTLAVTHSFHCLGEGDKATEKTYFNAEDKEGVEGKAQLLCAQNGGKEEECQETALGNVTYKEAVKIDG